jgi:hypothetical protein
MCRDVLQPSLRITVRGLPRSASRAACPPVNGAAILILRHATAPFFHGRCEIHLPKKFKLSASEFLNYELLLMRAKHLKHFQTAPSEVARCRFSRNYAIATNR